MPICRNCGLDQDGTAKFCSSCGDSLAPGDASHTPGGTAKLTFLDARYEVISTIKSGAMGCVYRARDTRLNNIVALKKMHSSRMTPEDLQYAEKHFREEGEMLSTLHHGGLPKVIDYFTEDDPVTKSPAHYLVMTFIEGKDLDTIMDERGKRPFGVDEALDIFRQILSIFKYLHSRTPPVIYRDLNPRNVMIREGQVFLVDFGIARLFSPGQKGTAIGTPSYTAPEQYKGFAEPRSDLYSLGALMHYLLTGNDPEDASNTLFTFLPLRDLSPDVPRYLEGIIMSLVDIVPDRRPSSAADVMRMLDSRDMRGGSRHGARPAEFGDIFEAVKWGDAAAIRGFILSGADVDAQNEAGLTPLHLAALSGQKEAARALIQGGANVNACDSRGHTALNYARGNGHLDIAGMLCARVVGEPVSARKPVPVTPDLQPAKAEFSFPARLRTSVLISLAALAIMGLICHLLLKEEHFKWHMKEANRYFCEKNYRASVEIAQKALEVYPADREAHELLKASYGKLAEKLYNDGDFFGLENVLNLLEELEPGNETAVRLGAKLGQKREIDKQVELGDVLFSRREFSKALAAYKKALNIEPDNRYVRIKVNQAERGGEFLVLVREARKSLEKKEFDAAFKKVQKALSIAPEDQEACELLDRACNALKEERIARAATMLEKKNFREARRLMKMILIVEPGNSKAVDIYEKSGLGLLADGVKLGKTLFGSGELDSAYEFMKAIGEIGPLNEEGQKLMGEIETGIFLRNQYKTQGDNASSRQEYREAFRCYNEALTYDPANRELKRTLLKTCSRLEKKLTADLEACDPGKPAAVWGSAALLRHTLFH